jgi:hypothetical protein
MDEVGGDEFCEERGEDISEEDGRLRDIGADEVEGCGEDYHVGDIVDEACRISAKCVGKEQESVPKSQKEMRTEESAPAKMALRRALYIAHEEPGEPGRGRIPEDEGDLFIAALYDSCDATG